MIELTPDERRGILQEYFRSKAETGVAHVSCPAAAAPPPIDGWDDRTWFLFMPDGRGGYVADYAFIAWAGAHRRLAWVMRIPFTMLLFVLVGLFLHWRIDREVGWLLAGGIFVAGFAGLHLLLSWLYTLPATLRVRKLRYVALPPDLAEQIIRIDGSAT
jgi:hypothetical protein